MNKSYALAVLFFIALASTGCTNNQNRIIGADPGNDCISICAQAKMACADFMPEDECNNQCSAWDQATKDTVKSASDCSGMPAKPNDKMTDLIPEINQPNLPLAKNDCEAACNKYVSNCLTLVPNANQALFLDGYNSCLGECAKWDTKKVGCMIRASDCPAMTEVCGL